MPGPLSVIVTRKRVAWLADGAAPLVDTTSSVTTTSGRMPASSDASSALSTASFTQVRSAFRGLSKPSRWRFLVKNSETEISRWRAPISTADTTVAIVYCDTRPVIERRALSRKSPRTTPSCGAGHGLDRDALTAPEDAPLDVRADLVDPSAARSCPLPDRSGPARQEQRDARKDDEQEQSREEREQIGPVGLPVLADRDIGEAQRHEEADADRRQEEPDP